MRNLVRNIYFKKQMMTRIYLTAKMSLSMECEIRLNPSNHRRPSNDLLSRLSFCCLAADDRKRVELVPSFEDELE
jgi:hypothetical protein